MSLFPLAATTFWSLDFLYKPIFKISFFRAIELEYGWGKAVLISNFERILSCILYFELTLCFVLFFPPIKWIHIHTGWLWL